MEIYSALKAIIILGRIPKKAKTGAIRLPAKKMLLVFRPISFLKLASWQLDSKESISALGKKFIH